MSNILIEAQGLTKEFPAGRGKKVHAVTDVSLRIHEGETLGIVGESGCGKSTLGNLLAHLLPPTSGRLYVRGEDVTDFNDRQFLKYRRQFQMIFQDTGAALDPRMTIRDIVAEPLETYRVCPTPEATTQKVAELLEAVGVSGEALPRYPHQFSGGQRQRIGIARAIAADPALIVCDEPVSALDVSVQNQILNLLGDLKKSRGLAYLFISHDLSVVRYISDRIGVMFLGRLCELGDTQDVFHRPLHPYTRFLLDAIPVPDPRRRDDKIELMKGEIPSPVNPPSGCRFHPLCPYASEECRREVPAFRDLEGRMVACHHPLKISH
ncbi:MAG: ABC transporter ATP-binding protein [Lachnospiraceae bacterium]|nr:ABC transporter ATP-binding protein [Lachnospiraceae bacterium]